MAVAADVVGTISDTTALHTNLKTEQTNLKTEVAHLYSPRQHTAVNKYQKLEVECPLTQQTVCAWLRQVLLSPQQLVPQPCMHIRIQ
jgi:hypothetical protein